MPSAPTTLFRDARPPAHHARQELAVLGVLLAKWGPVAAGDAVARACDLNRDGQVDGADLGILLSNWG